VLRSEVREVETGSWDVVFGLTDIHPESLHVVRVELAICSDCGEDFLFNWCGAELTWARPRESSTYLDAIEHFWVEEVDTGVDPVADEFHRFLDETVDGSRVWLGNDHTIVGGFCDLGDHDGAFTTVGHVEVAEVRTIRARLTHRNASKGYVQVTSAFRTKNGLSSLPRISRARARGPAGCQLGWVWELLTCAEGFGFDAKGDVDAEFVFRLLQDRHHDLGTVVDS
jgi:hypothetical protein